MVGQDALQLVDVLGLQQGFDGALGQLGEGAVDGGEHRERPWAGQRVDEARRLHGRDQGGQVLGVARVLGDGLVREHRRAADLRVRGREDRDGRERESDRDAGEGRALPEDFKHGCLQTSWGPFSTGYVVATPLRVLSFRAPHVFRRAHLDPLPSR